MAVYMSGFPRGRGPSVRYAIVIPSRAGCITASVQRTLRTIESSLTQFIRLTIDSAAILQNHKGTRHTGRGRKISTSFSPAHATFGGYAAANGGLLGDVLMINMRQDYRLGMVEGGLREKLEAVIELFGEAGLEADVKGNIIEWR